VCRHIGYVGPAAPLSWPLLDAPHSLRVQSYAPKDMRCGAIMNADGFGVGWYTEGTAEPARYRRSSPLWTDESLTGLAGAVAPGAFLAAARAATVGMPVVETACAPFTEGRWLFSHNGVVAGWPDTMLKQAESLPVRDLLVLDAPTDSALVWALLRYRLAGGADPAEALVSLTRELADAAPGSRLNFMLTDGEWLYATAWRHALSVLLDEPAGSVAIASEPYDSNPAWQPVPDAHLVVASRWRCEMHPIGGTHE
jgi:glutamine amidotransferase